MNHVQKMYVMYEASTWKTVFSYMFYAFNLEEKYESLI